VIVLYALTLIGAATVLALILAATEFNLLSTFVTLVAVSVVVSGAVLLALCGQDFGWWSL